MVVDRNSALPLATRRYPGTDERSSLMGLAPGEYHHATPKAFSAHLVMSLSDDEFGGVDDDDLIQLATQAEHGPSQHAREISIERSPKRRRLENYDRTGSSNAARSFKTTEASLRPQERSGSAQAPRRTLKSYFQNSSGSTADPDQPDQGSVGPSDSLTDDATEAAGERPAANGDLEASRRGKSRRSENEPIEISSQGSYSSRRPRTLPWETRPQAPRGNLKQANLFGQRAEGSAAASVLQTKRAHSRLLANANLAPTHHELDAETLRTWVYPTNLGQIRTYQFNIVARGLYHNLLVALPTGLGKTFIAATIMLNWYRWTKSAQIVFVAPTKPLVSQQVEACFHTAGVPRSDTTLLTGTTAPGVRAEEWNTKRVFFMTPQTLINDLKTGIADAKKIVLLVVDEAHRATGAYAYVEVVKFLRRFNSSFRVLALTATPGSTVEGVQEVIDGLGISDIEIRTEESIDIREYVHSRDVDPVLFENSEEMELLMGMYAKALQPVLNKLVGMNAYWNRDPMTMTPYGMNQARAKWMQSDAGRRANMGVKAMVNAVFTILAKLAHPIDLLKFHGIGPFYRSLLGIQNEPEGGKYRKQIVEDENFRKMMGMLQMWMQDTNFIGHPKLDYLQSVVLKHFVDASEGRADGDISPAHTRIMVFAHFRDSAEEIVRVLQRNEPMIRPHVFVGQAAAKGLEGMDQKSQLAIIEKFKSGIYNTLVATSIGEEGLDIGEVDLIVCYDASASPIRMLQRMGRTGRKRAGNIVVFLMKGKEENSFKQAKDNYQKMQEIIARGEKFTYHTDLAPRIVPQGVEPVVDKRIIEIPIENTQANFLPEPKKRAGRAPKRPPKKFHMPDGVRKGFTKASRLKDPREEDNSTDNESSEPAPRQKRPIPVRPRSPSVQPLPPLESALLTDAQDKELERLYRQVPGEGEVAVEALRLDAFPALQRTLRPTGSIGHSTASRCMVRALRAAHKHQNLDAARFEAALDSADKALVDANFKAQATPDLNGRQKTSDTAAQLRRTESSDPQIQDQGLDADEVAESAEDEVLDDLGAFIDDDESPNLDRSTVSSLSATSLPGKEEKEDPFYERTKVFSQESVDLPNVDELLKGSGRASPGKQVNGLAERRGRKRTIIESDDEE